MATDTQKLLIEIEVDSNEATQRVVNNKEAIRSLKDANNALNAEMKALRETNQADTATYNQKATAVATNEAKIKNLTAELGANMKAVKASVTEVNGEIGAYQDLQNRYAVAAQKAKDMAAAYGVNSKESKKATEEASKLDSQLKDIDKSVGQNQRNVGNYSSALDNLGGNFLRNLKSVDSFTQANGGLAGSFQAAGQEVAGMGKQLLALLANPIVAVIAAIAAVVMVLVSAFKQNGDAVEKMNVVMAPFKLVINAVTTALGQFVGFLISGAQAIMTFAGKIMSVIPGMKQVNAVMAESQQLERQRQQLAEQERADIVDDAKLRAKTAELKKELAQKDKYTAEERIRMSREIDNLEKANTADDMKRQIARHNNLVKQYNLEGKAYKDLTAQQKDDLRASEAKIYDIKAEYFEKTRRIGKMESTARQEIEAEKQKAIAEAEAQREKNEMESQARRQKRQDDELKKMETDYKIAYSRKYETAKLLEKGYYESSKKQIDDAYAAEIAIIEKKREYNKLTLEEEVLAKQQAAEKYHADTLKLTADMNAELIKQLDYTLQLKDINNKAELVGVAQTELQKYQLSIKTINDKYEADKKRIELTVTDEQEKNRKLELLNAQYNLDTKTANETHDAAIRQQKLTDEAELLRSQTEMRKESIDKEFDLKKEAFEKEKAERLKTVSAGSEAEAAIKAEYAAKEAENERQRNLAKADAVVGYAKQAAEVLGALNEFINALGEREYDNYRKRKDAELNDVYAKNDAELADWAEKNKGMEGFDEAYAAKKKEIEEKNAAEKARIEAELDEKKAEIEYEANKRAKELAIVQAIIGGAAAVIAALATPFAGPALAIAAGITAAAQLATIIATPIPDNRKGSTSSTTSATTASATYTKPDVSASTTNGSWVDMNQNGTNFTSGYGSIIKSDDAQTMYVPVLVTTDLTKAIEKQANVIVANEL